MVWKIIIALFIVTFFATYSEETTKDFINIKIDKIDSGTITAKIDGKDTSFKIAPKWYLMENGYSFRNGEEIKVKFTKSNDVNNITEVIKNKKSMKFTNEKGEFLWKRGGVSSPVTSAFGNDLRKPPELMPINGDGKNNDQWEKDRVRHHDGSDDRIHDGRDEPLPPSIPSPYPRPPHDGRGE